MLPLAERLVYVALARDTVQTVAKILAAESISVMPLKGVLLQRLVYDDPTDCEMTDVDVLVMPGGFERARELLVAAGFRPRSGTPMQTATSFFAPAGIVLDLQRELFGPGRFLLDAQSLFERSRSDRDLFGIDLRLPRDDDLLAFQIGKFVSDREGAGRRAPLDDIARIMERRGIDPDRFARRLPALGLSRAARYTLTLLRDSARIDAAAFARRALGALTRDPVGERLVALAVAARPHMVRVPAVGIVASHLLGHSLPGAARSLALAVVHRMQRPRTAC